MRIRTALLLSALAVAVTASGCRKPAEQYPPIQLTIADTQPKIDYSDLAAFLDDLTDGSCLLKRKALAKAKARLEAQVRLLAIAGPTATPGLLPTDEDRLAYWYNARCAWSLYLAAQAGAPRELPPAALEDRSFPLDGRTMTLRQIDEALLALGGWMAEVTAPGVLLQRAAPLEAPVAADDVREKIRDRFQCFLGDDKRFVIDVKAKAILVPPVLWQHREELIDEYERQTGAKDVRLPVALRTYVTRLPLKRLQDAVGYDCRQAPPSRKLARTEPKWPLETDSAP